QHLGADGASGSAGGVARAASGDSFRGRPGAAVRRHVLQHGAGAAERSAGAAGVRVQAGRGRADGGEAADGGARRVSRGGCAQGGAVRDRGGGGGGDRGGGDEPGASGGGRRSEGEGGEGR